MHFGSHYTHTEQQGKTKAIFTFSSHMLQELLFCYSLLLFGVKAELQKATAETVCVKEMPTVCIRKLLVVF